MKLTPETIAYEDGTALHMNGGQGPKFDGGASLFLDFDFMTMLIAKQIFMCTAQCACVPVVPIER